MLKEALPAPIWISSQWPFSVCVSSQPQFLDEKCDNEVRLGAVHKSPDIYLIAEINLS